MVVWFDATTSATTLLLVIQPFDNEVFGRCLPKPTVLAALGGQDEDGDTGSQQQRLPLLLGERRRV